MPYEKLYISDSQSQDTLYQEIALMMGGIKSKGVELYFWLKNFVKFLEGMWSVLI